MNTEIKINTAEAIIAEIKPLQLTKASAEGHAEVLTELVKEGIINPLDMATRLRYVMEVCEQTLKQIQSDAVSEAENYDKKEKVIFNGAKVQVAETGVKYNYENTGDIEWKENKAMEETYSAARKKREEFLKRVTEPMTLVHPDTGEITVIIPAAKTSSKSVKITFEQ